MRMGHVSNLMYLLPVLTVLLVLTVLSLLTVLLFLLLQGDRVIAYSLMCASTS